MAKNENDDGRGVHAAEDEPARSRRQVDDEPVSSTRLRLDRARRLAKRVWRRAVLDLSSLGREAARMGLKSKSYLGQTVDDEDDACPSLAHVYAASREVRRAIALDLLSGVDAEELGAEVQVPIEQQVLLLTETCGQLSGTTRRALADGVYTADELRLMLEDAQRVADDAGALCRDLRKGIEEREASQ